MKETPPHHCPGCGAQCKAFARYPWHFCRACLALCEDGNGRRLEFTNVSLSGGLAFRRKGEQDWSGEVGPVLCRLKGRPVLVREARFGGVVAEPMISGGPPRETLDLTRPD